MDDSFDLGKLLDEAKIQSDDHKVDLSGRPKPENVRVLLNSGIEVKCDVVYDGMQQGQRRYFVVAEIDWENYWPTTLIVGVRPVDVMMSFKMPDDMSDAEMFRRSGMLTVVVEKEIGVW